MLAFARRSFQPRDGDAAPIARTWMELRRELALSCCPLHAGTPTADVIILAEATRSASAWLPAATADGASWPRRASPASLGRAAARIRTRPRRSDRRPAAPR